MNSIHDKSSSKTSLNDLASSTIKPVLRKGPRGNMTIADLRILFLEPEEIEEENLETVEV